MLDDKFIEHFIERYRLQDRLYIITDLNRRYHLAPHGLLTRTQHDGPRCRGCDTRQSYTDADAHS